MCWHAGGRVAQYRRGKRSKTSPRRECLEDEVERNVGVDRDLLGEVDPVDVRQDLDLQTWIGHGIGLQAPIRIYRARAPSRV